MPFPPPTHTHLDRPYCLPTPDAPVCLVPLHTTQPALISSSTPLSALPSRLAGRCARALHPCTHARMHGQPHALACNIPAHHPSKARLLSGAIQWERYGISQAAHTGTERAEQTEDELGRLFISNSQLPHNAMPATSQGIEVRKNWRMVQVLAVQCCPAIVV